MTLPENILHTVHPANDPYIPDFAKIMNDHFSVLSQHIEGNLENGYKLISQVDLDGKLDLNNKKSADIVVSQDILYDPHSSSDHLRESIQFKDNLPHIDILNSSFLIKDPALGPNGKITAAGLVTSGENQSRLEFKDLQFKWQNPDELANSTKPDYVAPPSQTIKIPDYIETFSSPPSSVEQYPSIHLTSPHSDSFTKGSFDLDGNKTKYEFNNKNTEDSRLIENLNTQQYFDTTISSEMNNVIHKMWELEKQHQGVTAEILTTPVVNEPPLQPSLSTWTPPADFFPPRFNQSFTQNSDMNSNDFATKELR